jgi:hypothetical protein
MASFGPGRRSRDFAILDLALLRLRFQNPCGLGLNQNLAFLAERGLAAKNALFVKRAAIKSPY